MKKYLDMRKFGWMKRTMAVSVCAWIALLTSAQTISWPDYVSDTYVYSISTKQALALLSGETTAEKLVLGREPQTSYRNGDFWQKIPMNGHFICANISQNKVGYRYRQQYPFEVLMFNVYDKFCLQVVDSTGRVRNDAKVKLDRTRVRFNRKSQTYVTADRWSEATNRILTVKMDGVTAIFDLERDKPWHSSGGNRNKKDKREQFYSYLITDKNKYKPRETVRFKSYALSGKRLPLTDTLTVLLGSGDKQIAKITPYHAGGYADEFVLADSLKLTLDNSYWLRLVDAKKRIVASTYFEYEDYELKEAKMSTKLDKRSHYRPQTNRLEISVTDANNLPLQNVQANVTVCCTGVGNVYCPKATLPDTLMKKTLTLNSDAPTYIDIPSDLFGEADCSYKVDVVAKTFDNQVLEQRQWASYYYQAHEMNVSTSGDSVKFAFFELGEEIRGIEAELSYGEKGNETKKNVNLPYSEIFNPNRECYIFYIPSKNYKKTFSVDNIPTSLEWTGGFEKDTLRIHLQNPLKINGTWYIYAGDHLLKKGEGTTVNYEDMHADLGKAYYAEWFYALDGQAYSKKRTFVPEKERLGIDVNLPERAYPGQKIEATVNVSKSSGAPAADVDLTAFAVNSQLDYNVPDLPYYGSQPRTRPQSDSYEMDLKDYDFTSKLDYTYWNKVAQLDTMPYYQFTHPGLHVFNYYVPTPDGTTEFAPFVMRNGEAVEISVIEVNDKPVYFSWADQPKTYSFLAPDSDAIKITLRMDSVAIVLRDAKFDKGMKNIFSLDFDYITNHRWQNIDIIFFTSMSGKSSITETEKWRYRQYLSAFDVPYDLDSAYLVQDSLVVPIYRRGLNIRRDVMTVGPIPLGYSSFCGGVRYLHTNGGRYSFSDNVVYKQDYSSLIPERFSRSTATTFPQLNDFALTPTLYARKVQAYEQSIRKWQPENINLKLDSWTMHVVLPEERDSSGVHTLLFENCATHDIFSVDDLSTSSDFIEGQYNVVVLYQNGNYLKMNDVKMQKFAYIYTDMRTAQFQTPNPLYASWLAWPSYFLAERDRNAYMHDWEAARQKQLVDVMKFSATGNIICGHIYDETGEPIMMANVTIRNPETRAIKDAATTDINGYFVLKVNEPQVTIEVACVGYKTETLTLNKNTRIKLVMKDAQSLQACVVVAPPLLRPQSIAMAEEASYYITRDIDALKSGRVAGLAISDNKQLVNEALPEKQAEAEATLYAELLQMDGLRRNFSDVGFWQPRLYTDRNGTANFSFTLPDNITQWNAVVYAMNRKLQTGTARRHIRSYKPLMAELKMPQFLVAGDTCNFVGSVRNYTKDSLVRGTLTFALDTDTLFQKPLETAGGHRDLLTLSAPLSADSLTALYTFTRTDGYCDGEQRTIPLVAQGTEVADGELGFLVKAGDTYTATADRDEELTVTLTGQPLDIYMNVANYLSGYKYACNEQLASKLIGLLNCKAYLAYKNQPFEHDKQVKELISRLQANQKGDQLWTWWGNEGGTSYWISAHVLRALHLAEKAEYDTDIDLSDISPDYSSVVPYQGINLSDIDVLSALAEQGVEQDYRASANILLNHIKRLEMKEDTLVRKEKNYVRRSYLQEKLLLWELLQTQCKVSVADSLKPYLKKDVLGRIYVDDGTQPRYRWWGWDDRKLTNTLIAYRIVRQDSTLQTQTMPMQMYILSTRSHGWNTYQSAMALYSIVPDLLASAQGNPSESAAILDGKERRTLAAKDLPYKTQLQPGETLNVRLTGGLPLIHDAYSLHHVTQTDSCEAFSVKSSLSARKLRGGTPVTLTVTVRVKQAGAEYVMIEVPIPAGCSYNSKTQNYSYASRETHREYFKEKTVIFCDHLPVGTYTYDINLLPRYSGRYTLNPAKIELMYHPVIHANNALRSVQISEDDEEK